MAEYDVLGGDRHQLIKYSTRSATVLSALDEVSLKRPDNMETESVSY
jgi:hypothetical protein